MKIGVVLTKVASDGSYSSGQTVTEKDIDQALFNAMNKQGGIDGHKIQPVYATTDPSASEWTTEFAAACATFTEDNHVQAVLGYQFNYDQGFENCLTKANVPHLTTGYNIPDAAELASHPLHRSLAVPTIDHRSIAKLSGAIQDGILTKSSHLGVVIDSCPGTQSSWTKVVQPFLKSHGINVATVFAGSCSNGNNAGASDQIAAIPNGILKMRQAGVDTVTFLTTSEGPALAVVSPIAESQGWRPKYITSSLANLSALEGAKLPTAQMQNVHSYGWIPSQDVRPSSQPPLTLSQQRCLHLLKSSGIVLSNFGDLTNAYRICDAAFAYEAAVTHNNGSVEGASVVKALDTLGTSFSNPEVLDGATVFGSGRQNAAPAHMRAVSWKSSCSCFAYTGPVRALP